MSGYGVAPVANAVRGVVGIVNAGVSWLGREGNAEENMSMVNEKGLNAVMKDRAWLVNVTTGNSE